MSPSGANLLRLIRRVAGDRSFLLFLVNFGFGKGIAFIGPILLGLLLGPQLYGALEFGLALAMVISMIAMAGVPQAMMQIVLMRRGSYVDDLLLACTAVVAALAFAAACLCWRAGIDVRYQIAAAIVALCAAQQSGVAWARAYAMPNLNVWIDHAPTVTIVLIAVLLIACGMGNDVAIAATILSGLAVCVSIIAAALAWRKKAPFISKRLRDAVAVGLPLVAASLVGVWIITSGRISIGLLLTEEDIFAYAFTFRISSLLLLIHAVVMTAFAARLYKMPSRRFDVLAAALVGGIAAAAILFIIVAPERIAARWGAPDKLGILDARPAIVLIPAQIFFWIAGACVEMRVARARGAWFSTSASLCLALCIAALVFALYLAGRIDLQMLVRLLVLQQIGHCLVLHLALARRRVPLRKTGLATLIGGAFIGAVAVFASH